jgi:hypothetical protein
VHHTCGRCGSHAHLLQGTANTAALAHWQRDPCCVLAAGEISCPAAHLERMLLSPCVRYWTWLITETFAGKHCMRGFCRLRLALLLVCTKSVLASIGHSVSKTDVVAR